MGMNTHVIGFTPPDEKWKRMKKVWDACIRASVPVPKEVETFFNHEPPDEAGVKINLESHECVTIFQEEGYSGFDVEISNLPPDIKIIRFYNSW